MFMKKGSIMTNESRLKMSLSKKGKPGVRLGLKHSESSKLKMSLSHKGIKLSDERRKNMSLSRIGNKNSLGRKQSKETREKMRLSHIQRRINLNADYVPYISDILRRKRMKQQGGIHSISEWETLKAQYNWTCPCCKKDETTIKLTRDHIIPISKGGTDNIENIQPLCRPCNTRKYMSIIKY